MIPLSLGCHVNPQPACLSWVVLGGGDRGGAGPRRRAGPGERGSGVV